MSDTLCTVISEVGVRRRLQALVFMGHSPSLIASTLQVPVDTLWSFLSGNPCLDVHAVATPSLELFDALWHVRVEGPAGDRLRAQARGAGWVGPLGWDDLDDPREEPSQAGLYSTRTDSSGRTSAQRRGEVIRLHSERHTDVSIAGILRVSTKTILRDRQHLGLPAVPTDQARKVAL